MAAVTTPRRSTRGTFATPVTPTSLFTPTTSQPNVTYTWLSDPLSTSTSPSGTKRTRYDAYVRVKSRKSKSDNAPVWTPKKKKKGDEESEFAIGDGVLIGGQGDADHVAIIVDLWEEEKAEKAPGEDDEESEGSESEQEEDEDDGPKMMAMVHWVFRQEDLPDIRKAIKVEDNEVLLPSNSNRSWTDPFPLHALKRTVPIYTRDNYRELYPDNVGKQWRGWAIVRENVFWCDRAYNPYGKGGTHWRINIEEWVEAGKKGLGWEVPERQEELEKTGENVGEDEESEESRSEGSELAVDEDEEDEEGSSGEDEDEPAEGASKKRKRSAKSTKPPPKRSKKVAAPTERPIKAPKKSRAGPKKIPHPKTFTGALPADVLPTEELPIDPFERALLLLHVGATPESLPCREVEYVDVMSKVEEGISSGGGGCLYIAGVPGTGKTATVHAVVKELRRKALDGELASFSYVEINGLKIPTPQHAYTVLWEAISGAKNASAKTALKGLEAHFGKASGRARGPRSHTFVVLMDELDQLLTTKQDVVYNFFNWPTMRDSRLFVIAVANRMDLPQHLAAKIKSRLGLQTVLFQPYDREALISIVRSRLVPHPLAPSKDPAVIHYDSIRLAAARMAGTNGDARRVLDACRRAVEVAIENKDKTPPPGHEGPGPYVVLPQQMLAVLSSMSSSPTAKFIKACSLQQKMMLAALVRCVRREGVSEVSWRNVRTDHDALSRSLQFDKAAEASASALVLTGQDAGAGLLSNAELALVLASLISSHALVCSVEGGKGLDERKVALGMEVGEVGRVLMHEGESWSRALAGI
ncbi:hypothetical protein IAT38_003974 [Cryptococcus sp. DSM 104549]